MIPISANPSNGDTIGLDELKTSILKMTKELPKVKRYGNGEEEISEQPFRFAIDHCFSVRGQGTVLTGTVLSGKVSVNQLIEFPDLKIQKKVKSIQMFRKPVTNAVKGDRIGICVTQLNAKLIERGIAGDPGAYIQTNGAIVSAQKIKFFKGSIKSKSRMHISIGHSTVMATIQVFSLSPLDSKVDKNELFNFDRDYLFQEQLQPDSEEYPTGSQFLLLSFEKKIICPANCMVIGSKLDTDIHANVCRLAFCGNLLDTIDSTSKEELKKLKIFKPRERSGVIDRAIDEHYVIGTKLFKKETNLTLFLGLKVIRSNGAEGIIESSFGKSGKFKVYFPSGGQSGTDGELVLHYKKYIYNHDKKIFQ